MTLKEIKEKFDLVWKQIEDFILIGSKEESERFKRKRLWLEQDSAKKVKTSDGVSKEDLKDMMQLVLVEEVYVEALQVKHLIINWEIQTEGERSYWKIIRLGGSTASYQFFVDMLKHFDRRDLNQLWALVKETLNIRQAANDKEKELWVELKRLSEPDVEDQLTPCPIKGVLRKKLLTSSKLVMRDLLGAIMVPISQRRSRYYLSKWVEAKTLPTNDARVVVKFLKSLFSRFGIPRAIISDRGTHFCNDQFTRVMIKYGVTHRLATASHPQTSGQVEVYNHGLKRILERTMGESRASWSNKLDDALWAFCTAYKTLIGCTPYKLVYGKSCHLLIQLEHRAYWALKHDTFDLKTVGDHRKLQLNELSELRDQAYENFVI
nr:reverse transcriptase domain-containing protein [Tanacetum cinerariifolium]